MILPSCQTKAVFAACLTACSVEVCLRPKNGSSPHAPLFVLHRLPIESRAPADTLRDEGYTILAAEAGDLSDASILARLTEAVRKGKGLGALVHTAGLSPAQADWKTILRVNSLITNKLVDAMEPLLMPGTVGILIASMAGYVNLPMHRS